MNLRANVEYYELEVADRRVKAQLVDALVGMRGKRPSKRFWETGTGTDLKALCRALGIDDSGRRKADLIARLVAPTEQQEGKEVPEAAPRTGRKTKKRGKATAQPSGNGATTGYESELWAMARCAPGLNGRFGVQARRPGGSSSSSTSPTPSRRSGCNCSRSRSPMRRTPRSTSPRTSSGCRRRPAGHTCKPTPSNRASGRTSTTPCWRSRGNNASLKGVLPKDYARPALNKIMLGELIDLVSRIGMAEEVNRSRDNPRARVRVLPRRLRRGRG